MIWLNPWAWTGLACVALPVLIHLLGRGHARLHRFPTLRFLDASRLLPTRRTRIQDPLLLVVRSAAIGLAVAALARPFLLTAGRKQTLDRGVARAIIVDTSASMRRSTPTGLVALDSARLAARAAASDAQATITIESNDPARALAGAGAWLARQGRRAELVVISDFQRGQIDSSDFSVVAPKIGVRLRRIPAVTGGVAEAVAFAAGIRVGVRTTRVDDRTEAEWMLLGPSDRGEAVTLLGAESERALLTATHDAATIDAVPQPTDSARAIAIVFPKYADRAALHSSARPAYSPWMVDLLMHLRADGLRVTASGVANVAARQRLLLFTDSEPGSPAAARLTAAALGATSIAPAARELDPETLSDAVLQATARAASSDIAWQVHPTDDADLSDGRWLWIGVLALLLLEVPLRRTSTAVTTAPGEDHARAA